MNPPLYTEQNRWKPYQKPSSTSPFAIHPPIQPSSWCHTFYKKRMGEENVHRENRRCYIRVCVGFCLHSRSFVLCVREAGVWEWKRREIYIPMFSLWNHSEMYKVTEAIFCVRDVLWMLCLCLLEMLKRATSNPPKTWWATKQKIYRYMFCSVM